MLWTYTTTNPIVLGSMRLKKKYELSLLVNPKESLRIGFIKTSYSPTFIIIRNRIISGKVNILKLVIVKIVYEGLFQQIIIIYLIIIIIKKNISY